MLQSLFASIDSFGRRHVLLTALSTVILAIAATIALLSQYQVAGIAYEVF